MFRNLLKITSIDSQAHGLRIGTKRTWLNCDKYARGYAKKRFNSKNPLFLPTLIVPTNAKRIGKYEFLIDVDDYVHVYAQSYYERKAGEICRAGFGVYFDDDHPLNQGYPVVGKAINNTAEIQAATKAIELSAENGVNKLCINTGNNVVNKNKLDWMKQTRQRDWKTTDGETVANEQSFRALEHVLSNNPTILIRWQCVEVTGLQYLVMGKEKAFKLAEIGSEQYVPS